MEQVTIVVNFDLPVADKGRADCETYLHRIGRTGRFGKRGLAINLVSKKESETTLKQIQDHFGMFYCQSLISYCMSRQLVILLNYLELYMI